MQLNSVTSTLVLITLLALFSQIAFAQTSGWGADSPSERKTAFATDTNTEQKTIPYYFQYDNKEEGWRACNITSIAMVVDFFELPLSKPENQRTPDYLHSRFGIRQQPEELAAIFNIMARETNANVRNQFYEQGTIKQLRQHVKQGLPAIVHGWFTQSGHIMVVTGFDGEFYTVNDPAGQWNLKKHSEGKYNNEVSGNQIRYPAKAFEHAINDNGTGDDLWLHLFIPKTTK